VSEKLAAFAAIYAKEAAADVESKKADIVERTEKLKKATDLWTALKNESADLKIADTFKAVFPQAGGDFIAVSGNAANPSLTNLLGYGGKFKERVRELSESKFVKTNDKLNNAVTQLASAEKLAALGPEKYIDSLRQAIGAVAVTKDMQNLTFKTYEGFKDFMEFEITNTPGFTSVNLSQEAYEVLKEKFEEATSSNTKTAEKTTVSPINEPPSKSLTVASPTNSGINLTKGEEPKGAENTTEGTATVTEGKPEIVKPEAAPLPTTNINLNLEKGPESQAPAASSNVSSQSVINTTNVSTPPSLEPATASLTQQTLDLSKNTTDSSSTINSKSVSQPTQTTGDVVSTASNSTVINEGPAPSNNTAVVENTTINQTSVEKEKKKPGFFKKALSKAGALLSPLLENTSESKSSISEMVKAKLNKVLPINSVDNVVNNNKKEKNSANQLNLTKSSTQIENSKTSVVAGDTANTNVSTTTNQPVIDATIEKINPTVEGNATTATPDAKPEILAPVTPPTQSPTLTEIKEPSPAKEEKSSKQSSQPQRSSSPDFSSLEKRLKRIEMALTNPLEVIIKEH